DEIVEAPCGRLVAIRAQIAEAVVTVVDGKGIARSQSIIGALAVGAAVALIVARALIVAGSVRLGRFRQIKPVARWPLFVARGIEPERRVPERRARGALFAARPVLAIGLCRAEAGDDRQKRGKSSQAQISHWPSRLRNSTPWPRPEIDGLCACVALY